jgi:hypothetical protein
MSDTLRETLSTEYDRLSSEPAAPTTSTDTTTASVETVTTSTPAPDGGASTSSASARSRDDQGRFAKGGENAPDTKPAAGKGDSPAPSSPQAQGKEAVTGAQPAPATASATPAPVTASEPATTYKAPQSWKPVAREAWAKVPHDVQAEVIRREREIDQRLKETAHVRQTAGRSAAPYEGMLRAGSRSVRLSTALRSSYTIQHGPEHQKAESFAIMIRSSGASIDALAAALDGKPGATTSVAADPNLIAQQVEQRIRGQVQQQAAQVAAQRAQEKLSTFEASHEFFADVRETMADILAARRQPNPSDSELEAVYHLACKSRPEISGVLSQREAAKAAATAQAATQRAQAAASSVKSSPAGAAPSAHPKGLRAVLEAGYDEMSRSGRT